jgi:hypothetical protein
LNLSCLEKQGRQARGWQTPRQRRLLQALFFSVRRKTGRAKEDQMLYEMKPLSCNPTAISGMSEELITSHYQNNYGGTVQRLNELDPGNETGS